MELRRKQDILSTHPEVSVREISDKKDKDFKLKIKEFDNHPKLRTLGITA